MDNKDRKILELLEENSRRPFTEIAKVLDMSETAVRKRISKLEDKGAIKKYTIDIDPGILGYNIVSITGINTAPECFLEIAEKIKCLENVKDVSITSGDHTVMATIWAETGEQLSKIISEKIGTIEGVEKVFPAIVLESLED